MYCINCGKELREGAAFCVNCGTPTEVQNHPVTEPNTKVKAVADQEEKKGAKVLALAILFLGILAVVGIGGWFVIQGLNANRTDEGISEEKEEEKTDTKEAEPRQETLEAETGETEGNVPEVEDREMVADMPEPESQEPEEGLPDVVREDTEKEEKRDETGIHTYELIVEDVTWSQAYQNCIDKGGYLVRINSEEEYQTILQQIVDEDKKKIMFWLGGARSSEESEDYRWVYEDGTYGDIILNEEESYLSYWLSGEPSYSGEADDVEMYMNMFYVSKEGRWVWNDVADDLIETADFYAGRVGYICEYEVE